MTVTSTLLDFFNAHLGLSLLSPNSTDHSVVFSKKKVMCYLRLANIRDTADVLNTAANDAEDEESDDGDKENGNNGDEADNDEEVDNEKAKGIVSSLLSEATHLRKFSQLLDGLMTNSTSIIFYNPEAVSSSTKRMKIFTEDDTDYGRRIDLIVRNIINYITNSRSLSPPRNNVTHVPVHFSPSTGEKKVPEPLFMLKTKSLYYPCYY
ncbi:hypothetical protein BD770DRAFT_406513 [Pilaira anomala]|nr:hypothetical protein BD770DRAFT_406513 [Pilaira anomala]